MDVQFRPFFFSQEVLKKYYSWFNDKRFVGVLYQGTPKDKEEVRAWIMDCGENPSRRYFFVFCQNRLLGHVGLRNINFQRKHAEVGSFFVDGRDRRGRAMEEALKFIIQEAKKLNLKLLTADFTDEFQPQIKPFLKNSFVPNPGASHYLTLRL